MPDSVGFVGDYAFYGCMALKDVRISSGLSKIEKGMFNFCGALDNVVIPERVVEIGDYAFCRVYGPC